MLLLYILYRLDEETEGLILFSDDGELHAMMIEGGGESHKAEKVYHVQVEVANVLKHHIDSLTSPLVIKFILLSLVY